MYHHRARAARICMVEFAWLLIESNLQITWSKYSVFHDFEIWNLTPKLWNLQRFRTAGVERQLPIVRDRGYSYYKSITTDGGPPSATLLLPVELPTKFTQWLLDLLLLQLVCAILGTRHNAPHVKHCVSRALIHASARLYASTPGFVFPARRIPSVRIRYDLCRYVLSNAGVLSKRFQFWKVQLKGSGQKQL